MPHREQQISSAFFEYNNTTPDHGIVPLRTPLISLMFAKSVSINSRPARLPPVSKSTDEPALVKMALIAARLEPLEFCNRFVAAIVEVAERLIAPLAAKKPVALPTEMRVVLIESPMMPSEMIAPP